MSIPRIAVTMGDPAGVGPEICLRLLSDPVVVRRFTPIVFGDAEVLRRVASHTGLPAPQRVVSMEEWKASCDPSRASVIDLRAIRPDQVEAGRVSAATGRAAACYIEAAIEATLASRAEAIVTGPISKEALNLGGVEYPGHTELLAARTGAERVAMMLTSDEITCGLVTTHVGLHQVASLLTTERILDVIELCAEAMGRLRRRPPRIAVCALNPHAGEGGLFGNREEERIIAPAVALAVERGIDAIGPLSPDTAFLPERRRETDCYVCMYHDQGLIPLKTLAFDTAVNVTLGLPIVRASVDHGTATDIAWRGEASASSLIHACLLACRLADARAFVATRS